MKKQLNQIDIANNDSHGCLFLLLIATGIPLMIIGLFLILAF